MSGPGSPPPGRPEVAFVVQRYGAGVTGGSEALARAVAERLLPDFRVTVFTSCARDYVSWRNELPEGRETVNGVEVLRFPSVEERDLAAFNRFAEPLYGAPHAVEDEVEFLRRQGPHVPALVDALGAAKDRFDAVLFFTYLYYPTYWGLKAAPERAILVPTTHDEPPLRFGVYREVFELPRAFAFLTPPEEALVRSRFALGDRPALVAGMGVDAPERPEGDASAQRAVDNERRGIHSRGADDAFRKRHGLTRPYAVYAGRIDAGKGCDEMVAFFARYLQRTRRPLDLVLIGKLAMTLPDVPWVRYLGFLSEAEKTDALAAAEVVLCPSPYESLSIVLLEGLVLGIPALANARSPVLLDHCVRSNAGLYYENAEEFVEALDLLTRDPELRRVLGQAGRVYVDAHYRWDAVLERYRRLIRAVADA